MKSSPLSNIVTLPETDQHTDGQTHTGVAVGTKTWEISLSSSLNSIS